MRTHLDLCSGIGGFALAAAWAGYTTIGFCEIDPFCQRVLAHHWPGVPLHGDLRTLSAAVVRDWTPRPIDLLTAGYPCQPFSTAGKRGGAADDRHLWPAIAELVAALRPAWCLFENVAGHISLGLDEVLADLEGAGYAATALVVPACGLDAPHRRDRVWILAHATGDLRGTQRHDVDDSFDGSGHLLEHASDTEGPGRDAHGQPVGVQPQLPSAECGGRTIPNAEHAERGPGMAGGCSNGGQLGISSERPKGANSPASRRRGAVADADLAGWQEQRGAVAAAAQLVAAECGGSAVADAAGNDIGDANVQADTVTASGQAWQIPVRGSGADPESQAEQRVGEPDDGLSRWLAGRGLTDPRWQGDPRAAFGPDWEDGVPRVVAEERHRVNRLKALGNAIVPQIAYLLLAAIPEINA